MKSIVGRTVLINIVFFAMIAANTARPAAAQIPNPTLILIGQEPAKVGGKNIVRYNFEVFNFTEFPNELFAAAPDLPPCGKNTNSSRSWVDIFDQQGKRLNGFCALGKNKDLNSIWFALDEGVLPPSWVYIEINDRRSNSKYKSNLAETTM